MESNQTSDDRASSVMTPLVATTQVGAASAAPCAIATNLQENIKVAVRLRPFTEKEKQRNCKRCVDIEQNTVVLYCPKHEQEHNIKRFTFDHSYWSHDGFKRSPEGVNLPDELHPNSAKYVGQERVFADLGRFLLENALDGYNSALLAYGQTGSGKSYTVSGYGKNEGILPRFARELFSELEARSSQPQIAVRSMSGLEPLCSRFEVYFSMIEIYNEVVRDLLANSNGYQASNERRAQEQPQQQHQQQQLNRRGLRVREHPKRGFFVEDLTSLMCANKEEIERLIEEGQLNKSIAATSMNETSSRGHTIYEFRIKQFKSKERPPVPAGSEPATGESESETTPTAIKRPAPASNCEIETITTSMVQLVDLAGSERMAVHVKAMGAGATAGARQLLASDTCEGGTGRSSSPLRPHDDLALKQRGSPSTRRLPTSSAASHGSSSGAAPASQRQSRPPSVQVPAGQTTAPGSSSHQQRFKESISINQSLSALGNCIQVLSQHSQQQQQHSAGLAQQQPKIPYRDSVLTKLLNRCCLSGNSKVALIATLSPADTNYDDTLSTLRFADRAKQIRTHAHINRLSRGEMVNALRSENERLKQILDGRVTRSDDSSQTSNFDDSENMVDNFNGPKGAHKPKAEVGVGGAMTADESTLRRAPMNRAALGAVRASRAGAREATASTLVKGNTSLVLKGRRANVSRSSTRLDGEEQMKQLVSPAASKTSVRGQVLRPGHRTRPVGAQSEQHMRKSRSLGQGLAGQSSSASQVKEAELELVAGLLDDIELNDELAGQTDDENRLSPDSDDSFGPPLASDESLTNEEKINILNKLLSNPQMHNKMGANAAHSRARRRAGRGDGGRRVSTRAPAGESELSRVTAISSELKRTNPYLSNLNPDEQLTGMISYIIKPGEMILGKSAHECDLLIYGPELRAQHARLVRVDKAEGHSEVFIEPILSGDSKTNDATGQKVALLVNGEPALLRTKLNHCDRLLLGSNAYFVFIDLASPAAKSGEPARITEPDQVTYELAHNEVLRKVMSDAKNEAMIREINDYTHRPGTGKRSRDGAQEEQPAAKSAATGQGAGPGVKLSSVRNTRLTRSLTVHDDGAPPAPETRAGSRPSDSQSEPGEPPRATLGGIQEEAPAPVREAVAAGQSSNKQADESYRERLMEDTYEFAMPVAEANAIAKEMGIMVTYGLKILTGEEQLLTEEVAADQRSATLMETQGDESGPQPERRLVAAAGELIVTRNPIEPARLDLAPQLYVHVHLDELLLDFYWSKEKFQERREKMLELYGAWDLGGKSGLVEYLIEQSKYQGYYMIDPFIDDPLTSQVLIGHSQVTLRPISHLSDLRDSIDILDVEDEIVGSLQFEAIPCVANEALSTTAAGDMGTTRAKPDSERDGGADGNTSTGELPFRVMDGKELASNFIRRPERKLLGQKLVFMIKISSCKGISAQRYASVFCQYTLGGGGGGGGRTIVRTATRELQVPSSGVNEATDLADRLTQLGGEFESSTVPHEMAQYLNGGVPGNGDTGSSGLAADSDGSPVTVRFEHMNFVVVDRVDEEILNFLQHGFLTVQVVGRYRTTMQQQQQQQQQTGASATSRSSDSSSQPGAISSSSRLKEQHFHPTIISTIINSINKYRFRMERQAAEGQLMSGGNFSGSIYANSFSDSTKSNRITSSGALNSNSGASSVTSTSATINYFDQRDEDEEPSNSLNGISQENIIDMILTKRKLDRAENQLHYLKRTINIAEHYNKKHIPIKTVKKLLNSYGQELEGESLEDMAAEVTTEGKSVVGKKSGCSVQ